MALRYSVLSDCSLLGSSVCGVLQEYWSGVPSFTPRDLPDSRIEPTSADLPDSGIKSTSLVSPALAGRFSVFVFVFNYWQPLGNLILVKNPPASAGHRRDTGSVLGSERFLGGWHGNLSPGFLPGDSHEERRSRGLQSIKTELKWLNAHIYEDIITFDEDFIFPFHSSDRFEILYVAIDDRSFTFFRSPRFCLLLVVVLPFLLLERGESLSCHSFCHNPVLS